MKTYNINPLQKKAVIPGTCLLLLVLLVIPGSGSADQSVTILTDQKIPVGGGIRLSADIYKPSPPVQGHKTLPVILVITPYGSQNEAKQAKYFAANGYIYIIVNVRGREKSPGTFVPNENEGQDGAAVCRWIVKQPWCNGKIGMRGGSYRGMVQWLTAKHSPPGLKTIVPTSPAAPGIDYPFLNNIFFSFDIPWLVLVEGKSVNFERYSDTMYWKNQYLKAYKGEIPFFRLGQLTGTNAAVFNKWLKHPYFDSYWENLLPSKDYFAKIDIPVLNITGYFDEDHVGCLYYYTRYEKYAAKKEARENNYLLIGPWDHSGTRNPKQELGGLTFGKNAVINMNKLQLEWFDWILKEGKKPGFLKKRVTYYEMGSNCWKYADGIPELQQDVKRYYLSSGPGNTEAQTPGITGRLTGELQDNPLPDSYTYNPLDASAAAGYLQYDGVNYPFIRSFVKDCFTDSFNAADKKRLIYQTFPFEKNTVIGGCIKAKLYISMNVPDTDFRCDLYEIKPDGRVLYLTSDIMRARYRESLKKPEPVKPGVVYSYEFNRFYFFSREIPAGSCLRFVFGPIDSPEIQENFNSGGDVALETPAVSRTAIVKLFHNKNYPSYIEIPGLNQ